MHLRVRRVLRKARKKKSRSNHGYLPSQALHSVASLCGSTRTQLARLSAALRPVSVLEHPVSAPLPPLLSLFIVLRGCAGRLITVSSHFPKVADVRDTLSV